MSSDQILVGLIVTLVLGAYGYTFMTQRDLWKAIGHLRTLMTNHVAHRLEDVERRVTGLETREDHGNHGNRG